MNIFICIFVDVISNVSFKHELTHTMTRKIMLAAAVAAMTLATSCVTNKKYNALQTEYQATRDGLLECNSQTKSMEYLIKDLKSQNASLERQLEDMKATLNQSLLNSQMGSANIAKLVDEIQIGFAQHSPDQQADTLAEQRRAARCRHQGTQRGSVHLVGRQYALQYRVIRNQRPRHGYAVEDCQNHQGLQGL